MKKTLLMLLLINTVLISAQTFEWLQTPTINFNSNSGLIGYPTACDTNGNVYISGFANNIYNYTEIYGDIFYNKYDTSGQLIFSKTITGKAQVYYIESDSNNNIYIAVAYVQSMSIDNTTISTTSQGVKPLLIKFDPNGNLLWYLEMSTIDTTINHFKSFAIDANDQVYVCYDNYDYSYVKKLDTNGTVLQTIEQQNVNVISSVSVDNEGYIYTAGACANLNSKFAGVIVPTTFSYNTYIAKYSPTGVFQWVKFVQDITCSDPQVKAKSQNEVYFSSTLYGAYAFDGITASGPNNGYDVFISKLNSAGVFQWVKEVPNGGFAFLGKRNFLNLDALGNVYFAGSVTGTINWGNNVITNSTIYQDGLILKINPSGTILMAKTAGGLSTDRFDGVAINSLGDIYVSGIFRGTTNFDTILHIEPDQSNTYPVLSKINLSNLNTTNHSIETTIIYPNPTNDYFYIKNPKSYLKGEIFNVLGEKIKGFNIDSNPISIKDIAAGTYYIKLENNITIKLLKY